MFTGGALTARSAVINWQTLPQEDRNGVIIGYIINITSLDTGLTQQHTSTATNITITGLAPFTTYICIVAATTAVGPGPFGTTIAIQTPETGEFNSLHLVNYQKYMKFKKSNVVLFFYLCVFHSLIIAPDGNPSNFTGMALNSTHIYLSWDPPPANQVNGIIRGYQLNVTEAATSQVFQYVINATQITIGPLHPFYIYHCSVVAFTVQTGLNTSFFTILTAEDSK